MPVRAAADVRGSEVDEVDLVLANDLAELRRVRERADELLERRGIASRAAFATQLALEEIVSNVIRHGFRDGGRHEIALRLRAGADGVEIVVEDDGVAFDPVAAPAPRLDVPLAQRQVGGLGIHLVKSFVSEMRHERVGGRNVLWLRIANA